ncbi:ferredoxin [Micromonospora sp. NBC_00421]|uniref:ferredoxin n=1 Tax=Micromonospora sp. NBC_00421 TaxID=2975976 RepID=UPI002E1C0A14
MNITVDTGSCIGSGQCAASAPEVFDQDDDGRVVLIESRPAETFHDLVHEVAQCCPVQAISLDEY